jgi:glutathionylspermidine synthase
MVGMIGPGTAAECGITCGEQLPDAVYAALRSEMIFSCGKWDPQCGDTHVLAEFPLVLTSRTWDQLSAWSEDLAAETIAAEEELLERPDLHGLLGMPAPIRRALRAAQPAAAAGPRYMRFDFHPTTAGWRISEVNSDVPGGMIEADSLSTLMAGHVAGTAPAGAPGVALAGVVVERCRAGGDIGLVHATAYTDDRQVMMYLARLLEERGCTPYLIAPDHIRWERGRAHMVSAWRSGPLDAIIRFFPAEWLPNLPRRCGWGAFFAELQTPLSNPASALLTQSKRFPLAWDLIHTPLPTWRRLLPETIDPRTRQRRGLDPERWVLKPALGRVGEGVAISSVATDSTLRSARRWSRLCPGRWAAQQRFDSVPVNCGGREWHPCIGVFVVNGRAAGAYGRIAERPLIDFRARDIAVLVAEEQPAPTPTIGVRTHESARTL